MYKPSLAGYNQPMRQYERYLFLNLLWPAVLVTVALTGVVWLTQVLRFLDFMINRGLTASEFLYLTGLMLPSLLLLIIPIALTIAAIHTYNRLTVESELVVLNAVGVSRIQLARPMLLVGALAMLACYMLSVWLMPLSNQKFRDIRSLFRGKYASMLLEEGVFNTPIDGITVFVRDRDDRNGLRGILIHDNRNPKGVETMMASHGHLEQTTTGPRFYLENGQRQEIRDGRVNWLSFDNYTLDIAFYAKNIARKPAPDERSIRELFTLAGNTPRATASLRAEGHQRLAWPLFSVSLPLFALAVMFAGEFNRRGQWKRVVRAGIVAILMVMAFFALRNLLTKHPWLAAGLYVLVGGMVSMAYSMLVSGRLPSFGQGSPKIAREPS